MLHVDNIAWKFQPFQTISKVKILKTAEHFIWSMPPLKGKKIWNRKQQSSIFIIKYTEQGPSTNGVNPKRREFVKNVKKTISHASTGTRTQDLADI